ncbi:uncharacterized protein LOC119185752 isoform X1 [Rhipicephalus microplus]|uniref:uncharacterized protein LOC119185752 isoform X1 n=2 Tax=Rhipicephalus microplus TaxID=6941 RepID=UPI001888A52D|nr:uncharacterized protein LOC119185752 [Rhipicephalus microplus]
MPDLERVHRFREHPIAGVNWRPTRFVAEVPSSRVCGLCRMIPKRIVLLPCEHTLCQSCYAASWQGCSGLCPLDQEPFEEAECSDCDLPTRKWNALKVYCWNESHGCQFSGTMEDMLRHYETECTFHLAECLRCGEPVLHKELAGHYVAGCSVTGSTAGPGKTPSKSRALTLEDVTAAFEEMKSLLNDSNSDELLPVIQSQVNELKEQVGKQESTLAEITREVGERVRSQEAQVAASTSSSTFQLERASGRDRINQHGKSASENLVTPRELGNFPNLPADVLLGMRKTSGEDYPQHFIEIYGGSTVKGSLYLRTQSSKMRTWREVFGNIRYCLDFIDAGYMIYAGDSRIAQIAVLPTSDAYFTVEVCNCYNYIRVRIKFEGLFGDSCAAPFFYVKVYCWRRLRMVSMACYEWECVCKHIEDTRAHCHYEFRFPNDCDDSNDYIKDANMIFEIDMSRNFT